MKDICLKDIIMFLIFILSLIDLFIYRAYFIDLYSLKNKKEKSKVKTLFFMYNLFFSIVIIEIIIYNFEYKTKFILIFLIILSTLAKLIKKEKLANILCSILVVPTIILFPVINVVVHTDIVEDKRQQLSEVEVTVFNSKFWKYEGTYVSGTRVKNLVQQVISNNSDPENVDKQVKITGECTVNGTTYNIENINTKKRYSITIKEYQNMEKNKEDKYLGLIKSIEVQKKFNGGT